MSAAKHTPGPMTVKYNEDGEGFDAITFVGGNAVARRVPRSVSEFLAAAPEMAEALKAFLRAYPDWDPLSQQARAALEKAGL